MALSSKGYAVSEPALLTVTSAADLIDMPQDQIMEGLDGLLVEYKINKTWSLGYLADITVRFFDELQLRIGMSKYTNIVYYPS